MSQDAIKEALPIMVATAKRRLGVTEDAEDAVSEAALKCCQSFDQERGTLIGFIWHTLVSSTVPSLCRHKKGRIFSRTSYLEEENNEPETALPRGVFLEVDLPSYFEEIELAYIKLVAEKLDEPDEKPYTDSQLRRKLKLTEHKFEKMRENVRNKLRRLMEA